MIGFEIGTDLYENITLKDHQLQIGMSVMHTRILHYRIIARNCHWGAQLWDKEYVSPALDPQQAQNRPWLGARGHNTPWFGG